MKHYRNRKVQLTELCWRLQSQAAKKCRWKYAWDANFGLRSMLHFFI